MFQPIVDYNEDGNEPLNLRLSYSFANGSFQELIIPKEKLFVSTIGQGSAGISSDGAFSWQASPDLSQYTLTLALEDICISGQIQLQSVSTLTCHEQLVSDEMTRLHHLTPHVVPLMLVHGWSITGTCSGSIYFPTLSHP